MSLVHLTRRYTAPRRWHVGRGTTQGTHSRFDPLFHRWRAEIQQQTYGQISEPQIGSNLLAVNGSKHVDGLYLDKHEVLNDKICTIRALNGHAAVDQGHGPLSVDV